MRSYTSSRCTATSGGAVKPRRTWPPFTPSTVTVTSSPILTDSPRRLLRMSMAHPPDLISAACVERQRGGHKRLERNAECGVVVARLEELHHAVPAAAAGRGVVPEFVL